MKRALLINGSAVFLSALMILCATFTKSEESTPVVVSQTDKAVLAYRDNMAKRLDPDFYVTTYTVGTSMQQYGFSEGKAIRIYYNRKCKPGDFCTLRCLADKCKCPETTCPPDSAPDPYLYTKYLASVKDDCYWFVGNPEPEIVNGIEFNSFDSRTYGCLKLGEFEMIGLTVLAE